MSIGATAYPVSVFATKIKNKEDYGGAIAGLAGFLALVLLLAAIYALILHCPVRKFKFQNSTRVLTLLSSCKLSSTTNSKALPGQGAEIRSCL